MRRLLLAYVLLILLFSVTACEIAGTLSKNPEVETRGSALTADHAGITEIIDDYSYKAV